MQPTLNPYDTADKSTRGCTHLHPCTTSDKYIFRFGQIDKMLMSNQHAAFEKFMLLETNSNPVSHNSRFKLSGFHLWLLTNSHAASDQSK